MLKAVGRHIETAMPWKARKRTNCKPVIARPHASVVSPSRKQPQRLIFRLPMRSAIEPIRSRQQPHARLELGSVHPSAVEDLDSLRIDRSRPAESRLVRPVHERAKEFVEEGHGRHTAMNTVSKRYDATRSTYHRSRLLLSFKSCAMRGKEIVSRPVLMLPTNIIPVSVLIRKTVRLFEVTTGELAGWCSKANCSIGGWTWL